MRKAVHEDGNELPPVSSPRRRADQVCEIGNHLDQHVSMDVTS